MPHLCELRPVHGVSSRERAFGLLGPVLWLAAVTACGIGLSVSATHRGGEGGRRADSSEGALLAGQAGWYAKYSSADPKAAKVETLSQRSAFALKPGESIHPSIPAAGLEAVTESALNITQPGKYRFGAEIEGGTGRLYITGDMLKSATTVNFKADAPNGEMSDWLELKPGTLTLQYTFKRTADKAARLRPMWEMERKGLDGFRREPIPPAMTLVPSYKATEAATGAAAFEGRVLLGELGCVRCHATDAKSVNAVFAPPAPDLTTIGTRARAAWITKWITDPRAVKPDCLMPDVIPEAKSAEMALDVTHFLVSLTGEKSFRYEPVATETVTLDQGKESYATAGCVACHGMVGEKNPEGWTPPHAFGDLAGKWSASELSVFLRDPVKNHPGGRMPSMTLKAIEADLIATFLTNAWGDAKQHGDESFPVDVARVERGKAAFVTVGCAQCHTIKLGAETITSAIKFKPLSTMASKGGCLDAKNTKTPRYALTDTQRQSLSAAIEDLKKATGAPCPVDTGLRSIAALGCTQCHEYNAVGGVHKAINAAFKADTESDLGDEGRFPPRLTGAGGKLSTPWIKQVLLKAGRARPYMMCRMPQFGGGHGGVESLADNLAACDGVWANSDTPDPRSSDEQTAAGRRLVSAQGLNCISCHAFGELPLAGTPGPDIAQFSARIRYEWWNRYVHGPEREKPGTRMPAFYNTGKGAIADIYAGDPQKQSDAMWAYFAQGKFMPVPEGIPTPKGLQLSVGDKPRILRAFLKSAGSRAIAVGYPAGLHFAFDANQVKLLDAWTGNFVDASGAWAGRGGNPLGGQGAGAWTAPAGPPLVVAGAKPESWPGPTGKEGGYGFEGYDVDGEGVPTFAYHFASGSAKPVMVKERFEPGATNKTVRRTFTVSGIPAGRTLWFNAGAGTVTTSGVRPDGVASKTVDASGGVHWISFAPASSTEPWSVTFTTEVTP